MSSREERAKYQAKRLANPAHHSPAVGMVVTYRHPAGPVEGTLTQVAKQYVVLEVQRHGGLPPLSLKFTLRPDGEYRLVGTGNSARPALAFPEEQ